MRPMLWCIFVPWVRPRVQVKGILGKESFRGGTPRLAAGAPRLRRKCQMAAEHAALTVRSDWQHVISPLSASASTAPLYTNTPANTEEAQCGGGSLPGFSDSADGVIDSSSDCQVSFCSSGTKMFSSFASELCYSSRGHGGGAHGRPTAKLDLI